MFYFQVHMAHQKTKMKELNMVAVAEKYCNQLIKQKTAWKKEMLKKDKNVASAWSAQN